MFYDTEKFNQDISVWDVCNVTTGVIKLRTPPCKCSGKNLIL